MHYRLSRATLMMAVLIAPLMGCGVPQAEHQKVVTALEQANQEKATLAESIDTMQTEKQTLTQQIAELQKENQDLKTKLAAMAAPKPKPASVKAGSTPPAKKKK